MANKKKKKRLLLKKKAAKKVAAKKQANVKGKSFTIISNIDGRAATTIHGCVDAKDAREKFESGEYRPKDEQLLEWSYGDIRSVEEEK